VHSGDHEGDEKRAEGPSGRPAVGNSRELANGGRREGDTVVLVGEKGEKAPAWTGSHGRAGGYEARKTKNHALAPFLTRKTWTRVPGRIFAERRPKNHRHVENKPENGEDEPLTNQKLSWHYRERAKHSG